MRYGCAALLMLMSFAATASAQGGSALVGTRLVSGGQEARVSVDEIVARLMQFDRNRDFKLAVDELPERMQTLVVRGDRSDDLMLDAAEIKRMTSAGPEMPVLFKTPQFGQYGFGDTSTLSTRTHIENSIEDLKLTPYANVEAKRISTVFVDRMEATATARFRQALSTVMTSEQLAAFEGDLKRFANAATFQTTITTADGRKIVTASPDVSVVLVRHKLTPEQLQAASAAAETFKSDQQFDDARRLALAGELRGLLTEEERDDLRAALARRPIVKNAGLGRVVRVDQTFRFMAPAAN